MIVNNYTNVFLFLNAFLFLFCSMVLGIIYLFDWISARTTTAVMAALIFWYINFGMFM